MFKWYKYRLEELQNWFSSLIQHLFFCYKNLNLVHEKKTWKEALEYCQSHKTDLTYMDPKVLPDMSNAQTDSVWTGLHFLAGMWFWVSKENVGTNIGLPSCPPEPYRCGARNAKIGNWENRDCEEKLNFENEHMHVGRCNTHQGE
ncbi:hypothetical protein cypCar_00044990 [Cyprinus carpio]|nr:hypothetical protein cypCar_00044990 [Cyprinus carpio]